MAVPIINAPVMIPVISWPYVNHPSRAVVVVAVGIIPRIIPGTAVVIAESERKREIDPH